jgi:hypothetical protein
MRFSSLKWWVSFEAAAGRFQRAERKRRIANLSRNFRQGDAPVAGPVPRDHSCYEFGMFSLRAGIVPLAVQSEDSRRASLRESLSP